MRALRMWSFPRSMAILALPKAKYKSLKERLPKYGREPNDLAILPGIMTMVADSADQAREELAQLQQWLKASDATVRSVLTKRLGRDVSNYDLDAAIPELPETNLGQSFARDLVGSCAPREYDVSGPLQCSSRRREDTGPFAAPPRRSRISWKSGLWPRPPMDL